MPVLGVVAPIGVLSNDDSDSEVAVMVVALNVVNAPVLGVVAPIGVELIDVAVRVVNRPAAAVVCPMGVESNAEAVAVPRMDVVAVSVVNLPVDAVVAPMGVLSIEVADTAAKVVLPVALSDVKPPAAGVV